MTLIDPALLGQRAADRLVAATSDNGRASASTGLSTAELDAVEERFGFTFADDHRAFLAAVLPLGARWPDWRLGDEDALRDQLSWPVHGVLYDVEHNETWPAEWGSRPPAMVEALALAAERLATVPQLVPVYGHRYLPAGRGSAGHPVLSVYQTDIIYYGLDLDDYVHREFEVPAPAPRTPDWRPRATVPFWTQFL